jgi:NAD+ kinase
MDEPRRAFSQVGVVIHPSRPLEGALKAITAWTAAHGVALGQIPIDGQSRRVADPVAAAECDLLVALGGDGTALSALHAAAPASSPVLGVACGSIGALTSVRADRLDWALEQIAAGHWTPVGVPGLALTWGEAHSAVALNDVVVVRQGAGQIMVAVTVDDVLYARLAGDGVIVATALGSSAYTLAAGGPILAPGAEGMVVTPLAAHGGCSPPLVTGTASRVTLTIEPGHGGARFEIDGRPAQLDGKLVTILHRPDYATLVTLAEEEPRLTGLRRRGLVLDSPRMVVRDGR